MAEGPAPPTDAELAARVLAGDDEAFGQIVTRYQGRLVNFLYRMVRDLGTAHDLAQEAFLRVHQALDRYDPRYKFSTWIFRVAQNLGIDEIRRRRATMVSLQRSEPGGEEEWEWELPSSEPGPYADLRNLERGEAIERAVAELPESYRRLIVLRHFSELSYEDIAELEEMPLGTVKNKLFRGRQMLKEKLGAFLGD